MPSGHPIKLFKNQIEEIINDYSTGISARQLAKKYGFKCHKSIIKIIKDNNVSTKSQAESTSLARTKHFTDTEIAKLTRLNNNTEITINQIAKQLHCDPQTVKKELIKLGQYNKYKFDEFLITKFKIIDMEEKAYWIGFLTADGGISSTQITLRLAKKDKEHLQKFRNFIGINWKIITTKTKLNNKIFFGYQYNISSKKLVEYIKKYNLYSNKSFTTSIPNTIPNNMIKHYIRGIVDGDGSFCVSNNKLYFSLISSVKMCKQIQKILINECELNKTKLYIKQSKNGKMAYIKYCGNKQVTKIANYLYNNASIFLDRKKKIALSKNKSILST